MTPLEDFEEWCDDWFHLQIDGKKMAVSQFNIIYTSYINGYKHVEGQDDLVEFGNQRGCIKFMQGLFLDKPRIIVWRRRPVFDYEFDSDRHKLTFRCHFLTNDELRKFLKD